MYAIVQARGRQVKVTPGAVFRVEGLQGQPGVPARLVVFSNVVNPVNQARQLVLELDAAEGSAYRAGQAVNVQANGVRVRHHIQSELVGYSLSAAQGLGKRAG